MSDSRFMRALGDPWVDRAIAIVACVPFAYAIWHRLSAGTLTIPRACAALGMTITVVTMVARRAPRRVTPQPLWWLLAFAATYGSVFWAAFAPEGRPVVPAFVTSTLSIASILVVVYARLSLGRNIGFVPAQRNLVRSGAYAWVRHPIYSGLFIAWVSLTLHAFSWVNLGILLVICSLYAIKSVVEEEFLRQDASYAEYMAHVRFRFFPGII